VTVLLWLLIYSSIIHSTPQAESEEADIAQLQQRLFDAETRLPSDIRPTNLLLSEFTDSSTPLVQSLALDFVLLQIYRNIVMGKLDKAINQLNIIEKQPSSIGAFSRQLYFRAVIALKRVDFEQVFILLNRINQLDMAQLRVNHQFDIYLLAANVYNKANVFDDAIGYANKALAIAQQSNSTLLECRALNSLAAIHYNKQAFPALETLANQVISLCIDSPYKSEIVTGYFYLGLWFGQQQNYDQEQQLLRKSIAQYMQLETPLAQAKVRLYLANSFLLDNNLLDADRELTQALAIIMPSNDVAAKTFGYHIKAILLEKMGLLDDAMFYFKRYLSAHEASSNQTKLINLAYLQKRFESKVSRQARDLDKAESELANLRDQQVSLKNWVMLLSALLVASISLFLFVFFKRKQALSLIQQQQRDELTQCFNLDYGVIKANELVIEAVKANRNVAMITCNIDKMDNINVNFNYDFGDIFLHSFAIKLSNVTKLNRVTIRKTGDEFILLLTNLTHHDMLELVRDVHNAPSGIIIDNQSIDAQLSTGCAFILYQKDLVSDNLLNSLVEQSLDALQYAKSQGGNCGYSKEGAQYRVVRAASTIKYSS